MYIKFLYHFYISKPLISHMSDCITIVLFFSSLHIVTTSGFIYVFPCRVYPKILRTSNMAVFHLFGYSLDIVIHLDMRLKYRYVFVIDLSQGYYRIKWKTFPYRDLDRKSKDLLHKGRLSLNYPFLPLHSYLKENYSVIYLFKK